MIYLQLILEPDPHADQVPCVEIARELREILRRELLAPVTIGSADRTIADPHRDAPTRGDAVAVAALMLSIPSAALALHDLAVRTKLKDCLHRVLDHARKRRARAEWRSSVAHVALPGAGERSVDEIINELVRTHEP